MKTSRLIVSTVMGALLGIICIIGGSTRAGGFAGNEVYLLAMWYNRVLIGLVVGFAGVWFNLERPVTRCLRGALLGLIVSFAFYLTTQFRDTTAFIAGIVYGIIVEVVLWYVFDRK